MTREQVEQCRKFEQAFRWAKNNFVHMSLTEFNEVARLYKDILGVGMTKSQMNCGTCRLNALKALGGDYFATIDRLAKEDRENEAKKEDETPKKKGGRPKKINVE